MGQKTAEERIGEFLRFGSRLGLERMTALMHKLSDPQDDLNVIHIAGTNGKGSTARYIYESLIEAGYSTGIYTSPFIEKFNERIEADREMISDEDLESCTDVVLEKVAEMTDEGLESPTEFEVVTAVAFVWFKKIGCDAVVLEVGLGGRGDSTNIIKKPVISVITSISYDHMDRLGSTIPEIAAEKAGIIKTACPVVVSTERDEAMDVFRMKAAELGAPLYDALMITKSDIKELRPDGAVFDLTTSVRKVGACPGPEETGDTAAADDAPCIIRDLEISMGGQHQVTNAAEAVTALLIQKKFEVSEDAIRRGMARAKQPCRFEVLHKPGASRQDTEDKPRRHASRQPEPWIILDGAHNKDGAVKLHESVSRFFPKANILLVCGILKDKDVSGILDEFVAIGTDFIATEPENDRKLSAYDLAKEIHERGSLVYEVPKPENAAALAMSVARGYDVVLFTGSFYLIGKIRKLLREHYLAPGKEL